MTDEHATKQAILFMRVNRGIVGRKRMVERFLDLQRSSGQAMAEYLGAAIRREYVDYGDALEIGRRDTLLGMLGDLLLEQDIDYVIAEDWACFTRVPEDRELIERLARDAKTRIITMPELLDDNPRSAALIADVLAPGSNGGNPQQKGVDHVS